MTTPRDDISGLIERLKHLVSLNGGAAGGPYQGYAAKECVSAMSAAAAQLAAFSAMVKELEAEVEDMYTSLDANWTAHQRVVAAEARAIRAEQERDEAYERAAAIVDRIVMRLLDLDTAKERAMSDTAKRIAAAIRRLSAGPEKEKKE